MVDPQIQPWVLIPWSGSSSWSEQDSVVEDGPVVGAGVVEGGAVVGRGGVVGVPVTFGYMVGHRANGYIVPETRVPPAVIPLLRAASMLAEAFAGHAAGAVV